MGKEFKHEAFIIDWQVNYKSPFDAYLKLGVGYLLERIPQIELNELISSLKAQYIEGENIQEITINGENVRLIIGNGPILNNPLS